MDTMTSFMNSVEEIAYDYEDFIQKFSIRYKSFLSHLREIYEVSYAEQKKTIRNRLKKALGMRIKVDYRKLTPQQEQVLHMSWLLTQILYSTLTAPILTKDGVLDSNVYGILETARNSSPKLLEAGV